MKKVFVSHVFEDKKYIENMKVWKEDQTTCIRELIVETQHDFRPEGEKAIKEKLKRSIEKSDVVVVLIGNNTHNHDQIRIEIELANSMNKPVIVLRLLNTTGAKPLILSNKIEIKFSKNSFADALKK